MLLFLITLALASTDRVSLGARRHEKRGAWELHGLADMDQPLQFTMFLKQQNLDKLSELFDQISDPDSKSYRKFLALDELDNIVRAPEKAFKHIERWLGLHGDFKVARTADTMKVSTSVSVASKLFETRFDVYKHKRTGVKKTVFTGKLTMPKRIAVFVDFVGGISELWEHPERNSNILDPVKSQEDVKVTPEVLRNYYNIPEGESNSNSQNYQSVVAFRDYYSTGAFEYFYQNLTNRMAPEVQAEGNQCLNEAKPCDQGESNLDIQYMTVIADGVQTLFHNAADDSDWVLAFSEAALQMSPLPMVFSISYGWAELSQCQVAFMACNKLGYTSEQYVTRTETNFQRLAVMGASIMVADGDDGATGVIPNGWDPIDMDYWCVGEYVCYPRQMGDSKCGEILLRNQTTGAECVFPVAGSADDCEWMYLGDFFQPADIFAALKTQNPNCNMELYYDFDYGVHVYSECTCDSVHLIHEDVIGVPLQYDSSKRMFFADFPTASAYVTSVGATVFISSDGKTIEAEEAASVKNGAIITTGGGFSSMAAQPSWQQAAVNAWRDSGTEKPPASAYDVTKRGYPDVTMAGHNYQVAMADNEKSECPCSMVGVDGTSASSPAFAGIVSLLNGHLLDSGKPQLGFLNPLLYKMYAEEPSAFNDITAGDNKCTRNFCFEYGFVASEGWDPVAGLGSPNYAKMKEYVMNL